MVSAVVSPSKPAKKESKSPAKEKKSPPKKMSDADAIQATLRHMAEEEDIMKVGGLPPVATLRAGNRR